MYLSKQQKLDADSNAKQQISFTENLERDINTQMLFITEEAKKNCIFDLFLPFKMINSIANSFGKN